MDVSRLGKHRRHEEFSGVSVSEASGSQRPEVVAQHTPWPSESPHSFSTCGSVIFTV